MQNVAARRPRNIQFAVPRALQVIGHVRQAQRFARIDPHGSGINPGCGLLDMPGKTQIDHPAKGNPVIRPNGGYAKKKKYDSPKKDQPEPGSPETPADSNTQGSSPFRREKTLCSPQYPICLDAPSGRTGIRLHATPIDFEFAKRAGDESPAGVAARGLLAGAQHEREPHSSSLAKTVRGWWLPGESSASTGRLSSPRLRNS